MRDEAEAAAREAQRVRDETEEAEDAAAALQVARADAEALRAAASVESAIQEASEQDDLEATEPASDGSPSSVAGLSTLLSAGSLLRRRGHSL